MPTKTAQKPKPDDLAHDEARYRLLPAKKPKRCKCDMRTRLVGDGCEVCNPEYAADHAPAKKPRKPDGYWAIEYLSEYGYWSVVPELSEHRARGLAEHYRATGNPEARAVYLTRQAKRGKS